MKLAENDVAEGSQDDATSETTDDLNTGETLDEGGDEQQGESANDDEGQVITIGEETPASEEDEHAAAPQWVKDLRKTNRELARKNRELEQERIAREAAPQQQDKPIAKPTLAGEDYDEEAYERKLTTWHEQQAQAKAEQQKQADAQAAADAAWQARLTSYEKSKAELKVADADDAEAVAKEILSVTQQGIILGGADNSAMVIIALGKNPAKCRELAAITDPVKYAFAVAKLETQLKVTPRKAPPAPDRAVRGNSSVAISGDAALERLRAEAAKSGDMTKVMKYKQQKRAA